MLVEGATRAPKIADFRRRYPYGACPLTEGAQIKLHYMHDRSIKLLRFIPILEATIYVASIELASA